MFARYIKKKISSVIRRVPSRIARTRSRRRTKARIFIFPRIRQYLNRPADEFQNTHFHLAVQEGNSEIVQAMIRLGATVNATNWDNMTPLHMAVLYGHPSLIGILIRAGANIEAERLNGYRPIHMVIASKRKIQCLKELLKYGANINANTTTGNNVLQLLIKSEEKSIPLMKKLIQYGVDVDNVDYLKFNCLHIVAMNPGIPRCKAKILSKYLINAGINTNAQNLIGDTPLHDAIASDNDDLVLFLLKNGARIDIANESNLTPFEMAFQYSYGACLLVMLKYVLIRKHRGIPTDSRIMERIESNEELNTAYQKLEVELVGFKDKEILNCNIYDILCRKVDYIVGNYRLDPYAEISKPYVRLSNFHREIVDIWNDAKGNVDLYIGT